MIVMMMLLMIMMLLSIVNSYNIRVNRIRCITLLKNSIVDNDDDMIPPPPPGRGEWDDWDGTDAAIGGADNDNDDISFNGGSSILSMLSNVNDDDDDDINNYIITNIKDDNVKDKDIKKNKIVKTALKGKKKIKETIAEENFNDDDYDDRIDINITKGAGAFSPTGKSDDRAFSNNEGRGPMDSWGASYSEESPYFDEDDIIEDWSDRKSTFISSSMSGDLFAKPNIDDLIKSTTNDEYKEVATTSSVPSSSVSTTTAQTDISLLTITNEMNRRLNEIEMKSIIQYQDLKLFYCTVSAVQLVIILLLMKM